MSVIMPPSLFPSSFNKFINHMTWHSHNKIEMYSGLTRKESHYWFILWTPRDWCFTEHKDVFSCRLFIIIILHQLESINLSKLHFFPLSIERKIILHPIDPLMILESSWLLPSETPRSLHESTHNTDTKRQIQSRIAQVTKGSNQPHILSCIDIFLILILR